jgi:hypothetical protein
MTVTAVETLLTCWPPGPPERAKCSSKSSARSASFFKRSANSGSVLSTRQSSPALVSCLRNSIAFVAIKMGRRQGVRRARNRSRSRGTAAGPFSSQPPGPRSVGRFSVPRLRDSLLTYRFRYARRSRLEKQPTDPATAGRKACLFRGQDTRSGQRAEVRSVASLSLSSLPG